MTAPARATTESAGHDLVAYLSGRSVKVSGADGEMRKETMDDSTAATLHLLPGETALVPLGFKATLPAGYEAQIRMRSSWAFKFGLTLPNAPGTIDADYPDEWMVMMRADRRATIQHGDRVAQAVIARFAAPQWTEGRVGQSSDRAGGFGSTG